MSRRSVHWRIATWQLVLCVAGFVVLAMPHLSYTSTYWGFLGMSLTPIGDNQLFGFRGTRINEVKAGSPAAVTGLRAGDLVTSIADVSDPDLTTLQDRLNRLAQGEDIELKVKRGDFQLSLTASGTEPKLAAVVYNDWQLGVSAAFVVLILLIALTQPLDGFAPWRSAILFIAGFGMAAAAVFWTGTTRVWQKWLMTEWYEETAWRRMVVVVVAAIIVTLSTIDIRAAIIRRVATVESSNESNRR